MGDPDPASRPLELLRAGAREVARRARSVRIDDAAMEELAGVLARERPPKPAADPAQHRMEDDATTLAFVLCMNAINFGSGWFPHLRKSSGRSGYLTLCHALRTHFEREGAFRAGQLREIEPTWLARLLGQPMSEPIDELMELYAQALRELGDFVANAYGGRFAGPVEEAAGSAESLIGILGRMPLYRDVSRYQEIVLPFMKRAQITAADLAGAFEGEGFGHFDDLDRLTLFADNLVPHTLRVLGVLVYEPELLLEISEGRVIPHGSEPEIEIRAVALHAVERLSESCARRGWKATPARLDMLLWSRGQHPRIKAQPRHRTRCTFY